jgi:hypothetical protein
MIRQARTGDTVLGQDPIIAVVAAGWGRSGKDDRKQNTLASLLYPIHLFSVFLLYQAKKNRTWDFPGTRQAP